MSNTTFTTKMQGKVGSRGWAIALGLGAIVLATILLIVYLDRYRARVSGRNAPTQVLVSNRTITAGTPGTLVASQGMYTATTLPKKDVEAGAIADPQFLTGRAAAIDIFPGQQITDADFAASTSTTVDSQITGPQRAISVSIDPIHGSLSPGQGGRRRRHLRRHDPPRPGSTAEEQIIKLFRPATRVLAVPGPEGGNLILRVTAQDAADFAFAADTMRLWFVSARLPARRRLRRTRRPRKPCFVGPEEGSPHVPSRLVKAVLSVEPGVDVEQVQESLPDDPDFSVVAIATNADETLRHLDESSVDVLLVACAGYSDRALLLLDAVARQAPSLNVMVLGHGSPNGFLRRAFEAGADDIVMLPATPDQIRFEIHKLIARKHGADHEVVPVDSRLVCVLGPKGGTGKTLTATNLAVSLSQRGQRVALVDLDLQFGDVALCLGLPPERTVYDLAQSPGALDYDKLDAFLAHHSSGVRTLIAPRRPDQASAVGAELLREVYSILRATFDWVIVDTPPGFTAEVITSIDSSTDVVMVGMLDSLSLKNTKLGLETLELMKYDPDRVYLLLNRAHSRVGISQSDVEAVLGRTPDVFIPSDREIPRTVNEGIPIVVARPQSEPAEAFGRLSELLSGPVVAEEPVAVAAANSGSKRRLFGRKA